MKNIGETENIHRILVVKKPEEKRPLRGNRSRLCDNIKRNLTEMGQSGLGRVTA
jgi:hypothetical protein